MAGGADRARATIVWISVDDELPVADQPYSYGLESEPVLVTDGVHVNVGCYVASRNVSNGQKFWWGLVRSPTHWAKLPDPPTVQK